ADTIWSTVWLGAADLIAANAPDTCGAAIEVPAKQSYNWGFVVVRDDSISRFMAPSAQGGRGSPPVPPGASRATMDAMFQKLEIASALVVDATAIAVEMQDGASIALRRPSLPVEMTVATPALRRRSMEAFRGSLSHGLVKPLGLSPKLPTLILTAASDTP